MKKRYLALAFVLGALQFSCGETEEDIYADLEDPVEFAVNTDEIPLDETITDATEVITLAPESPNYAKSFDDFKSYLLNQEVESFVGMCSNVVTDPVHVMNVVNSDESFKALFMAATYDDLEEANIAGGYLMLNLLDAYEEEGEIYESALMFYFLRNEYGLMLDKFLAAG